MTRWKTRWGVVAMALACLFMLPACGDRWPESLGGSDSSSGRGRGGGGPRVPGEPAPPPPEPEPPDPLRVRHNLAYPTRVTVTDDDRVFVSDAQVGSVFIYDRDLRQKKELPGIAKPLGVAVGSDGLIYVGCDAMDRVEVWNDQAELVRTIDGALTPTDLALDAADTLYVVDTDSNLVRVYDLDGNEMYTLGAPDGEYEGLQDPTSIALGAEIYVASRKDARIHVFSLDGTFLRTMAGPFERRGSFRITIEWEGRFARIQDLAVDAAGRLHALDCWLNNIQILDATTGEFLGSYGPEGFDAAGELLKVPLGMDLDREGQCFVANTYRKKLEKFTPPQ